MIKKINIIFLNRSPKIIIESDTKENITSSPNIKLTFLRLRNFSFDHRKHDYLFAKKFHSREAIRILSTPIDFRSRAI